MSVSDMGDGFAGIYFIREAKTSTDSVGPDSVGEYLRVIKHQDTTEGIEKELFR